MTGPSWQYLCTKLVCNRFLMHWLIYQLFVSFSSLYAFLNSLLTLLIFIFSLCPLKMDIKISPIRKGSGRGVSMSFYHFVTLCVTNGLLKSIWAKTNLSLFGLKSMSQIFFPRASAHDQGPNGDLSMYLSHLTKLWSENLK